MPTRQQKARQQWKAEVFATEMIGIRLNDVHIGSVVKYPKGWIATAGTSTQRKASITPQRAALRMWGKFAAGAISEMMRAQGQD